MSINQVELSTGEWPINEIRPDEWADFWIAHKSPDQPHIPKEVLGGIIEKITPPDDSPLWDPYNYEMRLHNREWLHFLWLMGFATVDVPDDWVLPPGKALALDIKPIGPDDPRGHKLQYIQCHIIDTDEDAVAVQAATNSIITAKERAAGAEKFPDTDGDEEGHVGSPGSDTGGET